MTLSLFDATEPAPVELRQYQLDAIKAIKDSLSRSRSTLLVMATGTGKTSVFADVITGFPGKALVLAHREELVRQAASRIAMQTGLSVSVEKATEYGSRHSRSVIASVQTISMADRLAGWPADHFGLVVVDEAHHAVADTYKRVLDHFASAKVLGVTATPDRADELAMGQIFDDVAYIYEISDAINDGWLCRIRATYVQCDAVDLSAVKTVAGDLNQGELEMVMSSEAALHQVAIPTMKEAGDRRTIVFTTSVANAHRLAEVFCRYRPDCARAVDGETNPVSRRNIIADHQAGKFQFLCNVGVLTEGYDDPQIACIAMGRPTKSRALYAQMAGRGTRIAPGKSDLLLLDFVGNCGKHRLASAADILAGKYPGDVVAAAQKAIADDPGKDVAKALADAANFAAEMEKAQEGAARRRAAARTVVNYVKKEIDPFAILGIEAPKYTGRFGDEPATERQVAYLAKLKLPAMANMSKREAGKLIGEIHLRREKGLCTFAQEKTLQRYGYRNLTFDQARSVMDALARNNWKNLSAEASKRALVRETGAEG